eukprot:11844737-Prorocentrum_lima.AAC.1
MRRGTGVAGATPDVPVGEHVVEEANADDLGRADGTPGGTDVVGAPEEEPIVEGDPPVGGQRQDQDPSATSV